MEVGLAGRQPVRRLGEPDGRGAQDAVEAPVAEQDRVCADLDRQRVAARMPLGPAHLEHVAEIGGEAQAERHHDLALPVVGERQALVEPLLPQEAPALEVDDPFRCRGLAQRRQRPDGEVGGEQDIVLADHGTQERRRLPVQPQAEAGQDPGVVAEQAVAIAQDVAEGVCHQEGVAVLEREQAQRHARLAGIGGLGLVIRQRGDPRCRPQAAGAPATAPGRRRQ